MGVAFIALIVIGAALIAYNGVVLNKYRSNKIRSIYKGEEKIHIVHISIGNGELVFSRNTSITGWRVIAEYGDNSKPPEISKNETYLSVNLENGLLTVMINSLTSIEFSITNGNALVVIYNSSCEITGTVINGDIKAILNQGNYSLALTVTNGGIYLSINAERLGGFARVVNGDVDLIINTASGGIITYRISNGRSNIFADNFTVNRYRKDSGEEGSLRKRGNGINFEVTIDNGELTLVITNYAG